MWILDRFWQSEPQHNPRCYDLICSLMRLFKFCSVPLLLITNNWLQRTLTLTFNAWVIDLSNRAALHNERGFKEQNILVHSVDCSISHICICLKFIRMCCWEEVYLLYQPGLILKVFFFFYLTTKKDDKKLELPFAAPVYLVKQWKNKWDLHELHGQSHYDLRHIEASWYSDCVWERALWRCEVKRLRIIKVGEHES